MALLIWMTFSGGVPPDGMEGVAQSRALESSLLTLGIYAWLFFVYPLFGNMMRNLIWNHTSLEQHRFQSTMM